MSQMQNTHYVNDEYKYSIDFPENWIIESREEMYHVISCQTPDTSRVKKGSIKIIIQNVGDVNNIDLIVEKMTNPIKKFIAKDFTDIEKGKIIINGIEFYLYDYSYNYKSKDLPERQRNFNCYYLNNGKIYCLMFWGDELYFDNNKDLIMKSIESFKFLD